MTSDSPKTPSRPELDLAREAERLESLAALLDGDLEPDRRTEVFASLDGDELDLLAEVDALADEVAEVSFDDDEKADDEKADEHEPLPDNVVRGPWRRRAWAVATTLAAVLALVVLAPRLFLPDPPTPQMVVGALDLSTLPADRDLSNVWSPTRGIAGGGMTEERLSSRDSFRLGVLATDLETAALSGSEEDLGDLRPWIHQVVGETYLGASYSLLLDQPPAKALAEHRMLQTSILDWVDSFHYRYGLWLRAAWLAAESGQREFFDGGPARALDALEPPSEQLEEEIRGLRTEIRGLSSASDLAPLADRLSDIARDRAG